MDSLDIRGTTLAYQDAGSGAPLLLVHGSSSDLRTWDGLIDTFGAQYRTRSFSRRYHWPNPPIPEGTDYSMAEQLADLESVAASFVDEPIHFVGHSYGAFLCLLLAIRKPHLVRSLVLAEPPVVTLIASFPPGPTDILRLLLTKPRTGLALLRFGVTGAGPATAAAQRGDMDAAIEFFGNAVLGRDFYAKLSESRLQQVRANAFRAEFVGSGLLPLEPRALSSMAVRTLLLEGELSTGLFHRLNDELEQRLPTVERCQIPKASHLMHEDNPAAYAEQVLRFLASEPEELSGDSRP